MEPFTLADHGCGLSSLRGQPNDTSPLCLTLGKTLSAATDSLSSSFDPGYFFRPFFLATRFVAFLTGFFTIFFTGFFAFFTSFFTGFFAFAAGFFAGSFFGLGFALEGTLRAAQDVWEAAPVRRFPQRRE